MRGLAGLGGLAGFLGGWGGLGGRGGVRDVVQQLEISLQARLDLGHNQNPGE